MGDFWQRPLTDMGEAGPDKGTGSKYLIVGPGQDPGDASGYMVVRSPTLNVMIGTRVLDPDPGRGRALLGMVL